MKSFFFDDETEAKMCIVYTFKCTAECGHCITKSNMRRDEKLSIATAKEIILEAAKQNKKVVIFSGGEVFLFYNELVELIDYATSCGLNSQIETNGYWALSFEETDIKLRELKNKGLKVIYVSYDYFHSQYIPFENIGHVVLVCNRIGLKHEIMFTASNHPEKDQEILRLMHDKSFTVCVDTLLPFGRAVPLFSGQDLRDYKDIGYCDSLTTTFVPNGDVFVCCGINDDNTLLKKSSIYIGNIFHEKLEKILSKERENQFLRIISDEARLIGFIGFLKKKGLINGADFKKHYTICDLCLSLTTNEECMNLVKDYILTEDTHGYSITGLAGTD